MKKNRTKRYQVAIFLLFFLCAFALSAEIHGTMPGGQPSMTFDDGGLDYFVIFNSFLDNTQTLYGETAVNPQGDTCLDSSSFTLTDKHIPQDAIVEAAYIVWMGAVAPDKLDQPTDNEVTLSFDNENSVKPVAYSENVKAGDVGKVLTDIASFEFEGIKFEDDIFVGCNESEAGIQTKAVVGYFTYRVEVTEFMKRVQQEGVISGVVVSGEGQALYGKYSISDLECTDHDNYKCSGKMVSAWSLIVIYRSGEVRSKKIYFYNGLSQVKGEISKAEVSGFVLPKNPVVRQTLMVATGKKDISVNSDIPKEELILRGEGASKPYFIYNKCNPKNGDNYELYNSNSSIMHWNPDADEDDLITCVTGGVGDQNYGLDVDTFLLDAEKDINLMEHLAQGNTKVDVTMSVNENEIISNFLILSVSTKSPGWDIPPEARNVPFAHDREKQFCACKNPSEDDKDYYCYGERPFYFLIKVENWGTNIATDVWVSDELVDVDYVPGTAEIATKYVDAKGYYCDWASIQDKSGETAAEKFPLSGKGYKVADTMDTCDITTWTCKDSRFIRFLVKPKESLPKQAILHNTAVITDSSGVSYKTNNGFSLPLFGADCVGTESCAQPNSYDCGGGPDCCECETDDDCPVGLVCDGCNCVYPPPPPGCDNVEFGIGPHSPDDTYSHIIPRDNDGEFLVVGQLQLYATSSRCDESANFFFTALFARFVKNDPDIEFPEQQLVYDSNNDGVYTSGTDKIVSSTIIEETTGFRILIDEGETMYAGRTNHNFLIMTKISYSADKVPENVTFTFSIDSAASLHGENGAGELVFEGEKVEFATFMLEPEGNYFIATVGDHDASVPQYPEGWGDRHNNNEIPVLQVRTKSTDNANELKEITVKMTSGSMVIGEDISSLSLYQDMDGNGTGDVLLKRDIALSENIVTLKDFDVPLSYLAGESRVYVITADLHRIEEGEKMVLTIPESGVVLENDTTVIGLPIISKTFECEGYTCPQGSPVITCEIPCCECTITTVEKGPKIYAFLLFLLVFPLIGLFVRKKQ